MSMDSLAFDSVLELCRDQHRRIVLGVLTAEGRSLTLNDLTQTIFKYNHQMPITEVSAEVVTGVRVSLYHRHLPKLAAAGLIEFDSERRLVEPTTRLEQLQPTLTTILNADSTLELPMEL